MDRFDEPTSHPKEADATRQNGGSATPILQPQPEADGFVERLFAGSPGDPPPEKSVRLVQTSLSQRGSANARATALRYVQRQHGNQYVQRLISGVQLEGEGEVIPRDSSGESLDPNVRAYMEPRYNADFGAVRVHTDAKAAASAEAIGARAYTTGRDIYFAAGMYEPATSEGKHLLAHELAHTLQQSNGFGQVSVSQSPRGPVTIGAPDDPLETAADLAADLVTTDRDAQSFTSTTGTPLIQRDGPPDPAKKDPAEQEADKKFQAAGIYLSDDDKKKLLAAYPNGFDLTPDKLYVTGIWGSSVSSARIEGYRVAQKVQVAAGVETYILRVGKGRAIVVSSSGGPSIMLDAGSSVSGSVVQGLNAVVGAGAANAPERLLISHTDKDHINEAGNVMRASGMAATEVEIGLQQVSNTVGRADWLRANVQLTPGQSIVTIDVLQASGVHVQRRVIGNMELTEFRLVAPAQTLGTTGQPESRYKRAKNASSPVIVMQDILTGNTTVFTADGTGRAFAEIVDIVGESAFRTILGGGGRNLSLAEVPHHGGKEGPGPDARGRIRALRLQFEASDGTVRFFTQTSQSFSASPSASIRYLDQVGIETERILDQPAGTQGTSVVRAKGATLEDITIDNQAVQQVVQIARGNETEIMSAYKQFRTLDEVRDRAQALQGALSSVPERSEIAASVQQLITEMDNARTPVQQAVDSYWGALEAATGGAPGVRVGAATGAVNAAAANIAAAVRQTDVESFTASINAHEQLLGAELLLIQNALQMTKALTENRVEDLETLKVEQARLIGQAAAVLGAKEIRSQVRAAWKATRAVWTPEVIESFTAQLGSVAKAEREMNTDFRQVLGENLSAQLKANEIIERASTGVNPNIGMGARGVAGFMALIEILRIAGELVKSYNESKEAEEVAKTNRNIRGRNMVQWWISRGVVPEIALTDDDGDQVGKELSEKNIWDILSGKYDGKAPEYDQVVVTNVSIENRLYAVGQLTLQASNLDDWYSLVQDNRFSRQARGWTPFFTQDGKWYTLLFNLAEGEYQASFDQTVHNRLEALYTQLKQNQQAGFDLEKINNPNIDTKTIKDVALFWGEDRYVWVWTAPGALNRINLGTFKPKFTVLGDAFAALGPDGMKTVRAADAATYERLRPYFWPTGQIGMGAGGFTSHYFGMNYNGLGYVDPGHLQKAQPRLEDGATAEPFLNDTLYSTNGHALDPSTLDIMQARFGADFRDVRIHADSSAAQAARSIQAEAFTTGRDVYFGAGNYAPSTITGQRLLAHELAHTIQQTGPGPSDGATSTSEPMVTGAQDSEEQEAERAADLAVSAAPVETDHLTEFASGTPALAQRDIIDKTKTADVLPEPVEVIWGDDPFTISFERRVDPTGPNFCFIVRYTGPHPVSAVGLSEKSLTYLREAIDPTPLNVVVKTKAEGALAVDLYGYGDRIVRLTDEIRYDPSPDKGRGHEFKVKVLGDERISETLWVQDPKAAPVPKAQPQIAKQGDVPGENPVTNIIFADKGIFHEIRIDGDGDQMKELRVRLNATSYWPETSAKDRAKGVHLEIAQISSRQIRYFDFELPEPNIAGWIAPVVDQITDGRVPTKISLITPPSTQWMLVYPPSHGDENVTYLVEVPGHRVNFIFPSEATPQKQVATAGVPKWIGGIAYVDFILGAYNDPFRLTVQSMAKSPEETGAVQANVGIAGLFRGNATGGAGGFQMPVNHSPYLKVLSSSPVSLRIDVDGDKDHILEIFDQLSSSPVSRNAPSQPEKHRDHRIRIVSAASGDKTFDFTIRHGSAPQAAFAADKVAESNALAIPGLMAQKSEGTFQQQLDAYDSEFAAVRRQAVDVGIIQKKTYDSWKGLSDALIRLRPMINKNEVDADLRSSAATAAGEFWSNLTAETSGNAAYTEALVAKYPGAESGAGAGAEAPPMGPDIYLSNAISGAASLADWDRVYSAYRRFVEALDKWIIDQMKEKEKESPTRETKRAELLAGRKAALGALEDHKPVRVLAVFHPDEKFKTDFGYVSEIPLALYAWREGDTWTLRDLTNPEKPYDWHYSNSTFTEEPPLALLKKVDDPDHFPAGVLHFDIPGKYGGQIKTRDYLTWKKFFTYLGLALAAIGFTLATFGTGTVAAVGAVVLAESAIAGAIAAGIDLAEGREHGDLTTKRVILDLGAIVASLAGLSQLRSGLIVREAVTAAEEGRPLVGAAAEFAIFHERVYVVSTAFRLIADGTTLIVFEQSVWDQLKAIDNSPGLDEDKSRARWQLLAEGLGTTAMLALAIRGEIPALGGRKLILHFPVEGGPPIATVEGAEAAVVEPSGKAGPKKVGKPAGPEGIEEPVEPEGAGTPVEAGEVGQPLGPGEPGRPVLRGCFVAGTPVMTASGFVPIQSLTVGQEVRCLDPVTGESSTATIEVTFTAMVPEVLDIELDGVVLTCTPTHPFWVVGSGWSSAGQLQPGDTLLSNSGASVHVRSIAQRTGSFPVFNIEVAGVHTYFVSSLGILVHNKAAEAPTLAERIKSAEIDAVRLSKEAKELPVSESTQKRIAGLRAKAAKLKASYEKATSKVRQRAVESECTDLETELSDLADELEDLERAKAGPPTEKPPFPKEEFPDNDKGWQKWPPPKPGPRKEWYEPGGARYRYDRYRYEQWEAGRSQKSLKLPKQYFDEHVAPKAVGQSPGEMGSPEHKTAVQKVRTDNIIGTSTQGKMRPDAVGRPDQEIWVNRERFTPQKGARVLYEADYFFKDGSQIVSDGRAQVRQFRLDNPNDTIVVQDAEHAGRIFVYDPGWQPPQSGDLPAGTPWRVPFP